MHEATHVPFRSCAVCVGRHENPPHRRVPHDENAVPDILMDCYFARRDDETETVTLLVVEDHYSEPSKHGSSSEESQISMPLNVIQRAVKGPRSIGHRGCVAIKAGNEPAILALKEEIMRRPEVRAIPIESVTVIRKTTAPMKLG